jgi:uncharacterized membrane protein
MRLPYRLNPALEAATVGLVLAAIAASAYFYRAFPQRVAVHWNLYGHPDGWSNPAFAAFFMPALIAVCYAVVLAVPLLDPNKERYREFGRANQVIRLAITAFLVFTYLVASLNNLGYDLPIARLMPAGIGAMFLAIGNYMPKIKPNWFIGVRTPWTLSSEQVWVRTHRFSGRAFAVSGLVCLVAAFTAPVYAFIAVLLSAICVSALTVAYSWWIWTKLEPGRKPDSARTLRERRK